MKTIEQIALEIAQEIGESYSCEDGEYVVDPIDFATKLIEAWQAQQEPVAWACDVLQADATFKLELSTVEPPQDMYSVRNIRELFLAPQPATPEGYVLVPKEPR